jgi:HAD superfamily hydrolase (TIGR01509 family)
MAAGVLLDVEGTLVDCIGGTLAAWQDTLRDAGFAVPLATLQAHSGEDGPGLLRHVMPQSAVAAGRDQVAALGRDLVAAQGERYRRDHLWHARAFPGAGDLLRLLKAQGRQVALATSCARDELDHYLRLIDAGGAIDAIACGGDVPEGKPCPALLLLAMRRLGVAPAETVMIGDTPSDARAARAAGIGALGVTCGGFGRTALLAAGCMQVHRDPAALVAAGGVPEPLRARASHPARSA